MVEDLGLDAADVGPVLLLLENHLAYPALKVIIKKKLPKARYFFKYLMLMA